MFGDSKGKFVSPTSDSEGVKIREQTQRLSMNIISFSGPGKMKEHLGNLEGYLIRFAEAKEIEKKIITP
ncbi:MAG: hypothetical protein KGY60_11490 [Bacteroidales bacterium]|nr:hypothetical protein [Bacteroidales bacterium]